MINFQDSHLLRNIIAFTYNLLLQILDIWRCSMEKIKVLHCTGLNMGGIETFITNIYSKISNEVVFDFINYYDPEEEQYYEEYVKGLGSKVFKTGAWNEKNILKKHFYRMKSLYSVLKKNDYNVFHIHASDNMWIEDAIIAKICKVPKIIIHSHSNGMQKFTKHFGFKSIFHNMVKPLWSFFATDYFACSKDAGEWMFTSKQINSSKFRIINNGIDFSKFEFNIDDRNLIRDKLNLKDKFVVGQVGRLAPEKNHMLSLKVFRELIKEDQNRYHFVIIGSGVNYSTINEYIKNNGLSNYVTIIESSNEINKWMSAFDCLLFPSLFEGLGIVAIEAQANGLNILCSNHIPKDVDISNCIQFLSIDNDSDYINWSIAIKNLPNHFDTIRVYKPNYTSFNICDVVKELMLCYQN